MRPWRTVSPLAAFPPAALTSVKRRGSFVLAIRAPGSPPETYNHREALLASSLRTVRERYPELEDLVSKGRRVIKLKSRWSANLDWPSTAACSLPPPPPPVRPPALLLQATC